jgi:hypothetical protein
MPEFSISNLKDFDITPDGRKTILNFVEATGETLSLKISILDLERVTHEMGLILSKAPELSDISKQNIVPFLRPSKFRADLLAEGSTVLTVYQLASGIEHRYGLEPRGAEELARQMLDAAERGKKAIAPRRH